MPMRLQIFTLGLAGARAHQVGNQLTRLLDGTARAAPGRVQGGRVAAERELLGHHRDHLGNHRRRGRVVVVGANLAWTRRI